MLSPCFARLPKALRRWALLLTVSSAAAADPVHFTWTDAVAGNWSDATKWTDDLASGSAPAAAGLSGYTLEFSVAGAYTVTHDLDVGFLLNRMVLGGSELTLEGNALQFTADGATAPEIQQEGAAAVLISAPVVLGADLSFGGAGTGTVTLAGGVTGTGGLVKSGAGILALTGSAAYSGNTNVSGGTLQLAQANAANDSTTLSIAAGATLQLDFAGEDTVLSLVLDGVVQADGVYDASNSGGAITGTGAIKVFTPPPPVLTHFTWTDAVAGNWSDATKWTNNLASGSAPATAGSSAYTLEFSAAGTYTATQDLDTGFLLNRLVLGGSELSLEGNALQFVADGATAPEIQQGEAVPALINASIVMGADLAFGGAGSGTVTLAGGVSGSGGLVKSGSGILALSNSAAYSGNTTVNGGTLQFSQANAANDLSTVNIAAGATLQLDFAGEDTVLSLVLGGVAQSDGIYDASNSGGAITGTGAIKVFTPPITRFTWTDDVAGNWSDASKWTDNLLKSSAPVAAGQAAYAVDFSVAGAYTATQDLDTGFLLNRMVLGGSELILAGNAIQFVADGATAPEIQNTGAAPVLINAPVLLGVDLSCGGAGSGTVTLAGGVSGTGGLVKSGPGILALTGSAAYTGNTTVNGGALQLAQANAANDSTTLTIAAGATLQLDFAGNDTVLSLVLDGVVKPDGIYNASNSGGAITGTGAIKVFTPPPPVLSSNANLSALSVSGATLSPAFNSSTSAYSTTVGNNVTSITVTPATAFAGASVKVNGNPVSSGTPSLPINLNVGNNLVSTVVTAENGTTTKTYTLAVNRAAPATVATAPAVVIDASRATLNGTVNPNGVATVYFEYGLTPSYGSRTPERDVSGIGSRPFAASLTGLQGATTYHFRAVVVSPAGTVNGIDLSFLTPPQPPVAATGTPSAITSNSATLVGAVNPSGVKASAYFEYGLTTAYGQATAVQNIPAGTSTVGVQAANVALIPGATYHYRLVASNSAGTSLGDDVIFTVTNGTGGGNPTAAPTVTTASELGVTSESAILRGTVNPHKGTTLVRFEYGTSTSYGQFSPWQGIGNGEGEVDVARTLQGLLPGTTYHYRVTASNNLGTGLGADEEFTTAFPAPTAVTGASTILTTTSVKLDGTIRARGATVEAWIEYGTDGVSFPNSFRAVPGDVSGDVNTDVSYEVGNLQAGVTYYYRTRASGPNGEGLGETKSFDVASLSGLIQQFPPGVAEEDRDGSVTITLSPPDIGAGWRFAGEQFWRESAVPATGLTAGDRIVEYRPSPGYAKPGNETVAVASGGAPVALSRTYTVTADPANGSLSVFLKPQDLTEGAAPARWKFFGEDDAAWKESGFLVTGLAAGNYVILCKDVDGRSTPQPVTATVADGQTTNVTITYFLKEDQVGTPPDVLSFQALSSDQTLPNAYVGQLRGDAGSGSGFVVSPRVVVTAGHVIFDDGTLSATTGLQWLFQHDRNVHDPVPQTPRGFFLMSGYAAQRAADNSPGVSSPASQNLDAGTLFFFEDAGRGGFSGYLASDTLSNSFLLSSSFKTFSGYPIDGTPEANLDRMHATAPADVTFTKSFERTYITSAIRGSGGASGGPLCVLNENGAYYPAAIYLGGTNQTVVRSLDSDVVNMIKFAESSSGAAAGATGGSIAEPVLEAYDETTLGGLKVIIEPAAARAAGAGWKLSSQSSYLLSGAQLDDLAPDILNLSFATVDGFVPPAPQVATITAGSLTTITFTYEGIFDSPSVTSVGAVVGAKGQPLSYQIEADHTPLLYTLLGLLPNGLQFNPLTGVISGTLQEAGVFPVTIGASNSGGAGNRQLVITSLPVMADQVFTAPYHALMSYQPVSSETGIGGLSWTASGLPQGVLINPTTGLITGIPADPGVYPVNLSVTNRGAAATAKLALTITGIAPQITQQPAATKSIGYGTSTTLVVAATGLPDPVIQWYEGPSGDTGSPVPGATSTQFTTPPLKGNTSYWARASSISGYADSNACAISILPSGNSNLIGLSTSEGPVTPFNSATTSYTLNVPNEVPAILITPVVEVTQSIVKVRNVVVPTDAASDPINLNVGSNAIFIDVTSGDGSATKRYTLTVVRGQPPSVTTGSATPVADTTATLRGTSTPNGTGTVFFQYGATTAYGNATPGVEISGTSSQAIVVPVTGLSATTTYHFRIGITTGAGTIFGADKTFGTSASPPYVATGQASDVEATKVKLIGGVATNGTTTSVHFEWGETTSYGHSTPVQVVPGGPVVVDISYLLEGLTPDTIYHCRLVGTSSAGNAFGEDVAFIPNQSGSGTGTPQAIPAVTTVGSLDVTTSGATLQGTANPMGGTTFARFEYGLTTAYGNSSPVRGVGSGSDPAVVVAPITGLAPGKTYHYRLNATNSLGTGHGEDLTFQTSFSTPLAKTTGATPISSTSVRLTGTVNPRGTAAQAFFEYGTDGVNFPNRIAATPTTVNGDTDLAVHLDLADLQPGLTYRFRTVALRAGDPLSTSTGEVKSFQSDSLVGLLQIFPRELDASEHQGQLQVNLLPAGTGAWRFVGEIRWRASGSIATGLATGDREIEFLPVTGYNQPGRELVGVVSGAPMLVLNREYFVTPTTSTASLKVNLLPADRTGTTVSLTNRVQWRPFGYTGLPWRESGETINGITPGTYLIEFKAALNLHSPPPCKLVVAPGQARVATFAYNADQDADASSIRVLDYTEVSTRRNQPYAYVGQIRNDTGSHSGFAVKSRVVATTAQALFDEVTLSQIPGVEWLFQEDRDVNDPKPQTPRGFYAFDGYAAQRATENTPGKLSTAAEDLNVAALYFLADAGRGGYSGFVASDDASKPLLNATDLKTLVGYPVRGSGSTSNHGRMQASRVHTSAYTAVSAVSYDSTKIKGLSGMDGGPLCIQVGGGSYFPAGIFTGGGNPRSLVRAIDAGVIDLFNRAELTANTGNNNTSGGISQTSYTAISGTTAKGALTVVLEPLEARLAGALWKLGGDSSFVLSAARKNNMTPGDYVLQVKQIPGFQAIAQQTTSVLANNLTTVTITYLPELSAFFSWRVQYFGTSSNTGNAADGADPDGDGVTNLDEYTAGTNPLDPYDVFRPSSSGRVGNTFVVTVPAKIGRIYKLQRRTDLAAEDWSDVVTSVPILVNGPLTLTDPAATAGAGFYRVEVELVP